jgi:phosphatidylinositol alpha-1,6-mannosyltransferase
MRPIRETQLSAPGSGGLNGTKEKTISTISSSLTIISSEFPPGPGGIGTHAFEMSRQLHRLGWQVRVLSMQDYASDEEIRQFNDAQLYPVVRLPSQRGALRGVSLRLRFLKAQFKQFRPDIVMATGGPMVWLTALAILRAPVPFLAVGHGTEFGVRRGLNARLIRWGFEKARVVVCVSEFTRQQMLAMGVRPQCSVVIPNGADGSRFRILEPEETASARRELGIEEHTPLILTVGSVTERKGQEVVIRALPELIKQVPDVHYAMIGLPVRQAELTRLAQKLKVADRIHFLGRQDNDAVVRIMNACDLFVMTSVQTRTGDCEGYGIAAVEAALCGKPAVVSAGSGLAEAIVDGVTGVVVPQNSPSETARAIAQLIQDHAMRRRLGQAAMERARQEQLWEQRAQEYDRLLRSLLPDTEARLAPKQAEKTSR